MTKFHINPARGPMKCTAATRPCKYAEGFHFGSKAEAQEHYEAELNDKLGLLPKGRAKVEAHLAKSKVRGPDGELLAVYHGSSTDFDVFDPAFTGGGNDSYGSGFYFTTDQATATGYGDFTKKVTLNIENPLVVDGNEALSLNDVPIPLTAVKKIMRALPHVYEQPDSEAMNPLGDYLPEFWDKETHSKEELDRMIDKVAVSYFSDANFTTVESMFRAADTRFFRQALHEAMGWDGVEVRFERQGSSHWIAWFPEQVTLTD